MPNRNTDTMVEAIVNKLSKLPKGAVKTITCYMVVSLLIGEREKETKL